MAFHGRKEERPATRCTATHHASISILYTEQRRNIQPPPKKKLSIGISRTLTQNRPRKCSLPRPRKTPTHTISYKTSPSPLQSLYNKTKAPTTPTTPIPTIPNTPPLPSPNRIAPLVPLVVPLVPFPASAVTLGEITGTTPPAVGVGFPTVVPFTTCVPFAFAFPVGATRVPLTDARGGNTPALVAVVVVDGIGEVVAAGTSC